MSEKKPREPMQRRIAYAQLVFNHPILKEDRMTRCRYYGMLNYYCKRLFRITKYGKAILSYYKTFFNIERQSHNKKQLSTRLRVTLLLDIVHIAGYNSSFINSSVLKSFRFDSKLFAILDGLFSNLCYENSMWDELMNNKYVKAEAAWIECMRRNVAFSRKKPFKIMVTATMSAGKSTFINALVGERVASTNNLACTGRLHYIYSKPVDDFLIGKWDRQIVLDAQNSILNKNEETQERISYESIYYKGRLRGMHCMILDTPGVNSAEYQKHGECTNNAILSGAYDALVFLINYEHIGTDDEIAHLSFIKQNVNDSVPILFCVNKIDSMDMDDASLEVKMHSLKEYLQEQGFVDPTIFFVSSRAAFLNRLSSASNRALSKNETNEMLVNSVKLGIIDLPGLYHKLKLQFINKEDNRQYDDFDFQCGIGYIEEYIIKLMLKKERND